MMVTADEALEGAIALDVAMAEGLQGSLTAVERFLFLLERHGIDADLGAKARQGLGLIREVANLLEHDARLMRRPVPLQCGHAEASACAAVGCDGTSEAPQRKALEEICVCPWCNRNFTQLMPGAPPRCNVCGRPLIVTFGGQGIEIRKAVAVVHHLFHGVTDCSWSERFGVPGNWPKPDDAIKGTHHLWAAEWVDVSCVNCIAKKPAP